LMQLVAYGAQDVYLTTNPQITFFKVVYRRHTNFSMEVIEQTINGAVSTNATSTVTISRNGDLIHKIYITNAGNQSTTNGSGIVSQVDLEIGGQLIDRQYDEWNQIWNELSTQESKAAALKCMIGDVGTAGTADSSGPLMTQYPLNFWFCRNPGLALPLIALQYHEVKLKCTWGDNVNKGVDSNVKVMVDYVYLDTDERRRFAQVSHEYLIEQTQQRESLGDVSQKLNFNHPVKELVWTSQASSGYTTAKLVLNGHDRFAAQNAEYFQLRQPFDHHTAVPGQNLSHSDRVQMLDTPITTDITNHHSVPVADSKVDIDTTTITYAAAGNVDLSEGDLIQLTIEPASTEDAAFGGLHLVTDVTGAVCTISPGIGGVPVDDDAVQLYIVGSKGRQRCRTSQMTKKVNVYSFALKPEEHQPSGTCNFSRIDTAKLEFTGTQPTSSEYVYAVNYNVLRIMSGMGGLAYSN